MAENAPQTRSNHGRLDPVFHFVIAPVLLVLLLWCLVHAMRRPGTESVVLLLLVAMVLLTAFKARSYALKVQDRVIRLEERLRLALLLPLPAQALIPSLTESQLIALRFASDAECPGLVQRALSEKMTGRQIKEVIQNWRADHWRV